MNTEDEEFARIEREQAMRAVPDAIHHGDTSETLEYITGWNDCRQAMLAEQPAPVQEPIKWSDYEPDGLHHNKPAPVPGVVLRDGQPTQSDMRFLKLWPKPESRCLSLEDVADAAGVKQITAAKALSQLRKKGLIQKMGFKMRERGAVRTKWQSTTLGDAAVEEYLLRESEVIVLESKAQGGFVELPDGSSAWSEARTWGIIATSKSKLQDGTKLYPTPQPAQPAPAARKPLSWIATADELPPPGVRVFWMDQDSNRVGYDTWFGGHFRFTPSHWMHIPTIEAEAIKEKNT